MKLLSKLEMSIWAYYQCYYGNDIKEMRDLINDHSIAFWYCYTIRDDEDVRKHIINENDLSILRYIREHNEINK